MKYLTLFNYGIESRYTSSDERCAVLSGHSRLYKALGIEVMFARAGSTVKMNWVSRRQKKKQKIDFGNRSETLKKGVLKNWQKKKSYPSRRFFLFAAFPNFFSCANLVNRLRLADLGGVEPLRKLVRPKTKVGSALQ